MLLLARTAVYLRVLTVVVALGCSSSGGHDSDDDDTGSASSSLGMSCGSDCNGTFCSASGGAIDKVCNASDLDAPCLGTATGMYCSRSCASDDDCADANRAMRCLTDCATYPDQAGKCWSQSDAEFMATEVCP